MSKNPIVVEFSNADTNIAEILENHYDKNQFLETIFWKLTKEFKKRSKNMALFEEIDFAIIKGHPDSEVYFLFLSYSMAFALQMGQIQKVKIYDSILSSLPLEKTEVALQAFYFQNLAKLKFEEGKSIDCKEILFKLLKIIKGPNPRFLTFRVNCMNMFGGMGQLIEMGSFDENVPKEYINHHANSYYFAIIINCGMTGNVKLGLKVIEIFNNKFKDSDEFYKIENHEDTLNIISGDFDESNYKANSFKLHAKICHSLSIGDLDSAGFFIEQLINMEWVGFYQPYLIDGFVLNLELSKRNTGKVRLALSEKKELGKLLYLDDLYLGRLQLLEKNYFEADGTFRRLMANVVKYGAMNRLLFELQFAKEMKLSDILRLIDGWKSDSNQKTTSNIESHQRANLNILNGVRLLIGKSKMMQQIKNQIKKYAGLKDIVLITGETGTGKELVAKALHEEGPHSKEPFLAINCGSLTDTLLQSELFGYEAGAFTGAQKEKKGIFESVGKGTVFLDEFGDISPKLQVSLLRVLESNEILMLGGTRTRTIECKIVVASNIDFRSAVESKKFREDLYFRLAKFEIKLPALRQRKEDLPELIQYFLDKNKINNGKSKIISTDLLEAFSNYNWPGNIRELKNEIDRLNILNPESEILGIKQFDFSRFQNQSTVNNEFSIKERLDLNPNQNIQNDTISKIIQNGFPMENRHAMLKELFVKYKKLTRKQVVEILKIATTTATKDLQTLCDQGFIVRKTPTKSSRTDYFEVN